jgi:hypothetical protein
MQCGVPTLARLQSTPRPRASISGSPVKGQATWPTANRRAQASRRQADATGCGVFCPRWPTCEKAPPRRRRSWNCHLQSGWSVCCRRWRRPHGPALEYLHTRAHPCGARRRRRKRREGCVRPRRSHARGGVVEPNGKLLIAGRDLQIWDPRAGKPVGSRSGDSRRTAAWRGCIPSDAQPSSANARTQTSSAARM